MAAIKLTDKSGYPDNGYLDMQTLPMTLHRSSYGFGERCSVAPRSGVRPQTHFYASRAEKSHLVVTFSVMFVQRFLVTGNGGRVRSNPLNPRLPTSQVIIELICWLWQMLGRWYAVATYSNADVHVDSGVALLTASDKTNDVINLLFTGSMYSLSLLTHCMLSSRLPHRPHYCPVCPLSVRRCVRLSSRTGPWLENRNA